MAESGKTSPAFFGGYFFSPIFARILIYIHIGIALLKD